MGRCVVGEIKMAFVGEIKTADIYSHYYIFFNMTDLSWVSYDTPLLPAEIRVTINFRSRGGSFVAVDLRRLSHHFLRIHLHLRHTSRTYEPHLH